MQRETEECQHDNIVSMEYYNREYGRTLVVGRRCATCCEEIPIRIEDDYHIEMIEFFNQVQMEQNPQLLDANEKE